MAFFTSGKFVRLDEWRETLPSGESKYPEYADYDPYYDWYSMLPVDEYGEGCIDPLDKVNGFIDWYMEEDMTLEMEDSYVPAQSGRTGCGLRRKFAEKCLGDDLWSVEEKRDWRYDTKSWKSHRKAQHRLSFPQQRYEGAHALSRM